MVTKVQKEFIKGIGLVLVLLIFLFMLLYFFFWSSNSDANSIYIPPNLSSTLTTIFFSPQLFAFSMLALPILLILIYMAKKYGYLGENEP